MPRKWPGGTGYAPTFDNLSRLAELYQCAVSDLLVDLPDFRHRDTANSAPARAPADHEVRTTPRERDRAYHQLALFLRSWAHTMYCRDVLRLLGWAAATASLFPALGPDEQQRVASVLGGSSRVDAQTIEHIEAVLWHCRHQDYALGPQAALDTVLAQRNLARVLEPECPDALRPQMLSAQSEASRLAGWLSFDLKQFDDANYYYEDARALAHGAENVGLGAFVLCEMSHLATEQGRPRIGIEPCGRRHAPARLHR